MQILRLTFPDQSQWDVPVEVIARHRANAYKAEFDDDVERSLLEDTGPLFEESSFEIIDWAANNMNWSDVAPYARLAVPAPVLTDAEKQEAWMNGQKRVLQA